MPKYRKLYTKITQSFDFNDMPDDFTRCLWLLLPLGLDCEGRGIYLPSWVKSKIMPLREDVNNEMIETSMKWFAERGMIVVYEIDLRQYFYIPTFKKYQTGTDREAKSDLPAPDQKNKNDSRQTHEEVASKSNGSESASASESVNESEFVDVNESEINIFKIYENSIGTIPGSMAEKLIDAENEYPKEWIRDALAEAVKYNKRSWAYTETILKRWKANGRDENNGNNKDKKINVDPSTGGMYI